MTIYLQKTTEEKKEEKINKLEIGKKTNRKTLRKNMGKNKSFYLSGSLRSKLIITNVFPLFKSTSKFGMKMTHPNTRKATSKVV